MTAAIWLSALLAAAVASFWAESFRCCDEVGYYWYEPAPRSLPGIAGGHDCRMLLGCWRGGVFWLRTEAEIYTLDWYGGKQTPEIIANHCVDPSTASEILKSIAGAGFPQPRWRWGGFNFQPPASHPTLTMPRLFQRDQSIVIPHWALFLLFAIPGARRLRYLWIARWRGKKGFCRQCGYDLRASGRICPECGHDQSTVNPRRRRRWLPVAAVLAVVVAAISLKTMDRNVNARAEPFTRLSAGATFLRENPPRRVELEIAPGKTIRFALIPAGTFMMGSPESETDRYADETQHRVTISSPFYMGITTVTQEQYEAVMNDNPSDFADPTRPVYHVRWNEAEEFCHRLSRQTGWKLGLPTEAQWEYACRAGTTTPFHTGSLLTIDNADYADVMKYPMNRRYSSGFRPLPVGSFPPNAWGLYDMYGGVTQWCSDWYGDYPTGDATDPTGPPDGTQRVLRGFWWGGYPRLGRSASRHGQRPDLLYAEEGFRVVLAIQ